MVLLCYLCHQKKDNTYSKSFFCFCMPWIQTVFSSLFFVFLIWQNGCPSMCLAHVYSESTLQTDKHYCHHIKDNFKWESVSSFQQCLICGFLQWLFSAVPDLWVFAVTPELECFLPVQFHCLWLVAPEMWPLPPQLWDKSLSETLQKSLYIFWSSFLRMWSWEFVGALSPVNHKGLHQGWKQTSIYFQVIHCTSHHTTSLFFSNYISNSKHNLGTQNQKKTITHVLEPIYIPWTLNMGICI